MKGVYERRSPEWVMNMILNPDGMIARRSYCQSAVKRIQQRSHA